MMNRLKDNNGGTKETKIHKVSKYVKALFITVLGSKVLAEHCDEIAVKYGLDPDVFADAVYDTFELCVSSLE